MQSRERERFDAASVVWSRRHLTWGSCLRDGRRDLLGHRRRAWKSRSCPRHTREDDGSGGTLSKQTEHPAAALLCSAAFLLCCSATLVVSLPLCCVVMWSVVRLIGDSEEADTGINHDSTFDGSDGSRLIPASLSFNSWSAPISQTTNVFSHFRHSLHFSQGRFSDYFAKRH